MPSNIQEKKKRPKQWDYLNVPLGVSADCKRVLVENYV
jgi:hypothetical protein